MAGGSAFLALAGPIGWGIGAAALLGGGVWLRSKNKDIAQDATSKQIEIEGFRLERQAMAIAIERLIELTSNEATGVRNLVSSLLRDDINDYAALSNDQKDKLIALINHTRVLGLLLKKLPEGATV